jgi:glycosyltransferase involved in cell wall biosynthesis/SAM-dependent methyltransferase
MRKIFVDCSYLSAHQELNTGIQRVVRRVIENLETLSKYQDFEVIPVDISNNQFFRVSRDSLDHKKSNIELSSRVVRKIKERSKSIPLFQNRKIDLNPTKDDILLLLDSTWYSNIWPTVEMLKRKNLKVVAVIYDLIPITNAEFCDDFLAQVFKQWFEDSLNYVDGYISISDTVREDLISFLYKNFPKRVTKKSFDYFLLGDDFKYKSIDNFSLREELKDIFEARPTYLIVSTVEPRKNHKYLLDVFDKLWEDNIDVNLVIVGRVGWKVEEIMERIQKHKLLNKKLFHLSNINDRELLYCYQNSKMLLFPSIIEGFGLPIIESLSNSLPVLASNIPIHREVGGDNIGYFDISNPIDLVNQIKEIEKSGIPKNLQVDKNFKWISWLDSTKELLSKIEKMDKLDMEELDINKLVEKVKSKSENRGEDKFPIKDIYEYYDFTKYSDEEFVQYLYRAILKREVDRESLDYRVKQLREGKKSKMELITIVRASKEGRVNGVKLLGFYKRLLLTAIFSVFPLFAKNIRRLDSLENRLYLNIKETKSGLKVDLDSLESRLRLNIDETKSGLKGDLDSLENRLYLNINKNKKNIEILQKDLKRDIQNLSFDLNEKIDILIDKLDAKSDIEDIRDLYKQLLNQKDTIKEYLNRLDNFVDNSPKIDKKIEVERSNFDILYSQFEDRFRGDKKEIKSRLSIYIPFLHFIKRETEDIEILDIGCGRGEWLEILRENNYIAKGIDTNSNMVEICKSKSLNVEKIDAINYLKSLPNNSLSLITGFHIIEHLDSFDTLLELLEESHRVLKSGGFTIFETPNPRNILVGASDFYIDPSHKTPIHPMTLKFFVQKMGFENVTSLIINENSLIDIDEIEFASIDDYIYIGRDYCTIGYKI